MHASNIAQSATISSGATDDEQERAYIIDRRHQNYTASEGLGAYYDAYAAEVNLGTTIPDEVPEAALTEKFDDESNENGVWADEGGSLGATVTLVNAIRQHAASSNPSKYAYQYPRPFRWSDDVDVPPFAAPLQKPVEEAETDGGFPSGHTNAGHMAANGLAYAFPQQFDELMLQSAEIGTSRIELGMHSPLDVMGGRILSTAITAGALNDPELADEKEQALADAQEWIAAQDVEPVDVDYDEGLATWHEYMTFGFAQTGDADEQMRVPKGAEALIETALPYLTDEQRRWVLFSTGLESGYPVNDDEEGWGRLNLFAAAAGYGSFDTDVTVTMDAAAGALSAADEWKNDIDGAGALTKAGTGDLTLSGDNTFTGDVTIDGGALTAASVTALGTGSVVNATGILAEEVAGSPLTIAGDFTQGDGATLSLTAADAGHGNGAIGHGERGKVAAVEVDGSAHLSGSLEVALPELKRVPKRIALIEADAIEGAFDELSVMGLPDGVEATLETRNGTLSLVLR